MSQLVKRPVAKLKDLSSMSRIDMVEGENPYKLPSDIHIHGDTHTYNKCKKKKGPKYVY